jgi:hypothetical protein
MKAADVKTVTMKVLSAMGKIITFILITLGVLLLIAERLHETFFSPVVNFIRSMI